MAREALVVETRLVRQPKASSSEANKPLGYRDEIVLREGIRLPYVDPTGSNVERYTVIKRVTLPSGRKTAFRKTLSNEEVNQRRLAFGASRKQIAEGFIKGANAIGGLGGAVDLAILQSDFGSNPAFDGMNGSFLLGKMLAGQQLTFQPDDPDGMPAQNADGSPLIVDYGHGCLMLERDDIRYSETAAVGISPVTGRFSVSMFLAGPACMFQAIGGRFAKGMDDADPESETSLSGYNMLVSGMTNVSNNFDGNVKFYGYEGPANDKIAVIGFENLSLEEEMPEGGTVKITEIQKGIDADAYVTRYLTFKGTIEQDGKVEPISWRSSWDTFKTIPGTMLYEPRRQRVAFEGAMSAQDDAEMAEARRQLAEYERQLESMPANQRAMMERMVGPQIEQARKMLEGGTMEFEMLTDSIDVNPNLLDPDSSLAALSGEDQQQLLVKQIQKDLDTLGYKPGPMSGELTTQTVNAIKQFESDNEMPQTGRATLELANILNFKILAM